MNDPFVSRATLKVKCLHHQSAAVSRPRRDSGLQAARSDLLFCGSDTTHQWLAPPPEVRASHTPAPAVSGSTTPFSADKFPVWASSAAASSRVPSVPTAPASVPGATTLAFPVRKPTEPGLTVETTFPDRGYWNQWVPRAEMSVEPVGSWIGGCNMPVAAGSCVRKGRYRPCKM